MGDRIYVDLDNTLGHAIFRNEHVADFAPRPHSREFILALARRGEVWILSTAVCHYIVWALGRIGVEGLVRGILDRDAVYGAKDRETGIRRPVGPKGVLFDDLPVCCEGTKSKRSAIGTWGLPDSEWYVKVPFFGKYTKNDRGLLDVLNRFIFRKKHETEALA